MNAEREELLRLVAELSAADPELRLGQLIANLATLAQGAKPEAIWDAEDKELLARPNDYWAIIGRGKRRWSLDYRSKVSDRRFGSFSSALRTVGVPAPCSVGLPLSLAVSFSDA